jgi:type III secretory pathway component EscV
VVKCYVVKCGGRISMSMLFNDIKIVQLKFSKHNIDVNKCYFLLKMLNRDFSELVKHINKEILSVSLCIILKI